MSKIRGNTQIKAGSITNTEIAADAGIEVTKLEALTASGIVFTDANGFLTATALMGGDISWDGMGFNINSGVIVNADISNSAAIETSKLADGASFIKYDGSVTYMNDQSMGGNNLTNLADGVDSGDAVNKGQLDAAISAVTNNIDYKNPVLVVATSNLDLTGSETIDEVALPNNSRVLVAGQTNAYENGIYVSNSSGPWSRATDANTTDEVTAGMFCLVTSGTNYTGTGWVLTNSPSSLGMDDLNFIQIQAPNTTLAGDGLTKTGNTLDVVSANAAIVVNPDDIEFVVDTTADSLEITASGVKLKDGTPGQMYLADGSNVFKRVTMSGDITIGSDGTTAIGTGVIVNADINASAAIALSKLATGTAGYVVLANGSGVATYTQVTGDVTINSSGVTAIGTGVIVNADINSGAAIALSKLAAGTEAYIIVCDASGVPTYVPMSGDATIAANGTVTVTGGGLTSGDFEWNGVPTETPDGMITTFTLPSVPANSDAIVWVNGVRQKPTTDYTISGDEITFSVAPEGGLDPDEITAFYIIA